MDLGSLHDVGCIDTTGEAGNAGRAPGIDAVGFAIRRDRDAG